MTDYALNTAFNSRYLTGNELNITYLIETYLNYTVTSDELGLIIPEVINVYGSGKAVEIAGKFVKAPSVSKFTTTGQSVQGSLYLEFTIDGQLAIQVELDDIDVFAVISSSNGAIFGKISTASLGTIGAGFQTTLGMTADEFLSQVQTSVDGYVAQANDLLQKGVVIPSIKGIDISDIDIKFFDGYLEAGISVSPAFWSAVSDFLVQWKQSILKKRIPVTKYSSIKDLIYL